MIKIYNLNRYNEIMQYVDLSKVYKPTDCAHLRRSIRAAAATLPEQHARYVRRRATGAKVRDIASHYKTTPASVGRALRKPQARHLQDLIFMEQLTLTCDATAYRNHCLQHVLLNVPRGQPKKALAIIKQMNR